MEPKSDTLFSFNIFDLFSAIIILLTFSFLNILHIETSIPQNRGAASSSLQLSPTFFEVLSPNGYEKWEFGSVQEIKWSKKESVPVVDVYLITENGQQLLRKLLSKTENDGSEFWIVDIPPGRYKIQIQSCPGCSENSVWDSSDIAFTVVENNEAVIPPVQFPANESLIFFSPVGGEIYQPGENIIIRWYGGYKDWQLKLNLIPVSPSSTAVPFIIAEGVLNDGEFEWVVPPNLERSDYYMNIECSNCENIDSGTSAISFNYITIKIR